MPHYGFYTDVFGGELIPETAFHSAVCRAEDALAAMKRSYTVTGNSQQEDMALCAMAEVCYRARGVESASVGSVSVRYADAPKNALYQAASRYLRIYRGVGA